MTVRNILYATLATTLLTGCYTAEQGKHGSAERMKNATATIVTGIAAQQTLGNSHIDATIDRPFQFNSPVSGSTTPNTIRVEMEAPFKNNVFLAERGTDGYLHGKQDKHMFDWKLDQIDENSYEVSRVGFNATIDIDVENGRIEGRYNKPWGLDYKFEGQIHNDGTYNLDLKIPLAFDWEVAGNITPR